MRSGANPAVGLLDTNIGVSCGLGLQGRFGGVGFEAMDMAERCSQRVVRYCVVTSKPADEDFPWLVAAATRDGNASPQAPSAKANINASGP